MKNRAVLQLSLLILNILDTSFLFHNSSSNAFTYKAFAACIPDLIQLQDLVSIFYIITIKWFLGNIVTSLQPGICSIEH